MKKNASIQMAIKLLDVLLVLIPVLHIWNRAYLPRLTLANPKATTITLLVLYSILYYICVRIYGGFSLGISRINELAFCQILSALVADGSLWLLACVIGGRLITPLPGFAMLLVQCPIVVLWSLLAHRWYVHTFKPYRALMVYDGEDSYEEMESEYHFRAKFQVLQKVTMEELARMTDEELRRYQAVLVTHLPFLDRNTVLCRCYPLHIGVYILPEISDMLWNSAKTMDICHQLLMRVYFYENPTYTLLKRVIDVVLSGIALLVLSPVLLVTAIAIHVTDGGPVFYGQTRLTKGGRPFQILKFRSMRVDAEKDGVARLSTGDNDDRITPVGRFIRKVRIDELPQLINILKGDMSIVGPRPERPELTRRYMETLPEFGLRLQVKAGLTGYAQIYGKYNTTPQEKLMMDLHYLSHLSIRRDIALMIATVKVLFIPESTEGVTVGQTTAMK